MNANLTNIYPMSNFGSKIDEKIKKITKQTKFQIEPDNTGSVLSILMYILEAEIIKIPLDLPILDKHKLVDSSGSRRNVNSTYSKVLMGNSSMFTESEDEY